MFGSKHEDSARIMAQYQKATKQPNEYIAFSIDEQKISEWYILIHNLCGDNDEYVGGQYLVKMVWKGIANPPEFCFYTPNGVYNTYDNACIDIGIYHADKYRPALGMAGFAESLISGMISWRMLGGGIGLVETTVEDKKQLAIQSASYNETMHPEIVAQIRQQYAKYSMCEELTIRW